MTDDIPKRRRRPMPQSLRGPAQQIRSAQAAERQRQALELRKNRLTYDQIAKQLGYESPMGAWRAVQKAIANIPREVAQEVKQLEIEDCRADLLRLNRRLADKGATMSIVDLCKALGAKLKLREQLARYEGHYAPEQHEHSFLNRPVDVRQLTDEQVQRLASGDFGVLQEAAAAGNGAARAAAPAIAEGAPRGPRSPH